MKLFNFIVKISLIYTKSHCYDAIIFSLVSSLELLIEAHFKSLIQLVDISASTVRLEYRAKDILHHLLCYLSKDI